MCDFIQVVDNVLFSIVNVVFQLAETRKSGYDCIWLCWGEKFHLSVNCCCGGEWWRVTVCRFLFLYCARLYLSLSDLANSLKYFSICDRSSGSEQVCVGEKLSPLKSRLRTACTYCNCGL